MKTEKIEIKEDIMMLVRHVNFAVNLKPLLDKISELERLARIGKATEKAYECGHVFVFDDIWGLETIEDLLVWFESEDE
jgi:hypothetical protein